jgi:hypothetical protein
MAGLKYLSRLFNDPFSIETIFVGDIMINECGAVGGMRIGSGDRSTWRKRTAVPLCPPQIPHYLESNPGRYCKKPATNRPIYGTVYRLWYQRCSTHISSLHRICFWVKAKQNFLSYGVEIRNKNRLIYSPLKTLRNKVKLWDVA